MPDKRVEKKSTAMLRSVIRGTTVSVIVSVVLVLAFAVVLSFFPLSDTTIEIINQVLKLISVIAGSFAGVGTSRVMGFTKGAVTGGAYMVLGIASSAIIASVPMSAVSVLSDLLMGAGAGAIAGALMARRQGGAVKAKA